MLNPLSQAQIEAITLWHLVQHSLAGFRKIQAHYPSLADALQAGQLPVWQALGLHKSHLQRFQEFHTAQGRQQFQRCLQQIQQQSDFVLTCADADYPQQLLPYCDRPPVIFGQGDAQALLQPQIAIVGSRKPSPHGCQTAYDFAFYLSEQGFYICSGLAQGIDQAAHQAALKHRRTIAVMGTGLDQTYPPQHQGKAMGIAGAGNSGTALAALFGPGLAAAFGWVNVFGLALILVFIGTKMCLIDVFKIPVSVSLGVVIAILAVTMWLSLRTSPGKEHVGH